MPTPRTEIRFIEQSFQQFVRHATAAHALHPYSGQPSISLQTVTRAPGT